MGYDRPHQHPLSISTFGEDEVYDQKDAKGFIRLSALRLRMRAMRNND